MKRNFEHLPSVLCIFFSLLFGSALATAPEPTFIPVPPGYFHDQKEQKQEDIPTPLSHSPVSNVPPVRKENRSTSTTESPSTMETSASNESAALSNSQENEEEKYIRLGDEFAQRGEGKYALLEYQKACNIAPRSRKAHYRLMSAYAFLGNDEKVLEEANILLRLEPNDFSARNIKMEVEERLSKETQLAKEREYLNQIESESPPNNQTYLGEENTTSHETVPPASIPFETSIDLRYGFAIAIFVIIAGVAIWSVSKKEKIKYEAIEQSEVGISYSTSVGVDHQSKILLLIGSGLICLGVISPIFMGMSLMNMMRNHALVLISSAFAGVLGVLISNIVLIILSVLLSSGTILFGLINNHITIDAVWNLQIGFWLILSGSTSQMIGTLKFFNKTNHSNDVSEKNFNRKILIVLLILVGFAGGIYALNYLFTPRLAIGIPEGYLSETPLVEVQDFECHKDDKFVKCSGRLLNISNHTLNHLCTQVGFFASLDNRIDTTVGCANVEYTPLLPGYSTRFSSQIFWNPAFKIALLGVGGNIGGSWWDSKKKLSYRFSEGFMSQFSGRQSSKKPELKHWND